MTFAGFSSSIGRSQPRGQHDVTNVCSVESYQHAYAESSPGADVATYTFLGRFCRQNIEPE